MTRAGRARSARWRSTRKRLPFCRPRPSARRRRRSGCDAPRGTPEEAKPGATPFTTHHTSLPSPPPPPPPPRPRAHVYTFTAPPLQAARGRAQDRAAPSRRRACIRLALRPLGPAESRGPTILARNFAPILSPVVAPLVARAVGDELRRPAVARIVGWSQQGLLLRRRIGAWLTPILTRTVAAGVGAGQPSRQPTRLPWLLARRLGLRRQLPRVARIISRERPTVSPRGGVPSRSTRQADCRQRSTCHRGHERQQAPSTGLAARRLHLADGAAVDRARRAPGAAADGARRRRAQPAQGFIAIIVSGAAPVGPRAWQTACGRAAPRAEPRAGEPPPLSRQPELGRFRAHVGRRGVGAWARHRRQRALHRGRQSRGDEGECGLGKR